MKVHNLKTWPEYFAHIHLGEKRLEIRKNDRNFQVGDILILEEWDHGKAAYSGEEIHANVTYILQGGQFGIEEGYCAMGIDPYKFPDAWVSREVTADITPSISWPVGEIAFFPAALLLPDTARKWLGESILIQNSFLVQKWISETREYEWRLIPILTADDLPAV